METGGRRMPFGGAICDEVLGRGLGMPLPLGIPLGMPLGTGRPLDCGIRGMGDAPFVGDGGPRMTGSPLGRF